VWRTVFVSVGSLFMSLRKNAKKCYYNIVVPLEIWEAVVWVARRRKESRQKFFDNALQEVLAEIDLGKLDVSRPKNIWWGIADRIWCTYVDKVLKKQITREAKRIGYTVTGLINFALARRISQFVDPDNAGIDFQRKSLFT
jgi:hypothetical protein